jgi:acyl-CoA thioester hydrolase
MHRAACLSSAKPPSNTIRQLVYDTLIVTAELQNGGKASLMIVQRAYLRTPGQTQSNDRLLAEGTIRLGWVDSITLKPGRIPAPVLEALK